MKKIIKKVRSRPAPQVSSKSRKPVAKRISAKPDFIGRLKGIIRIVGDIESPVVPLEEWECCREDDLERINLAAERPNAEPVDATATRIPTERSQPGLIETTSRREISVR